MFIETLSGGFRYNCKNGGCDYQKTTGWEPANGFFGKPRRLFYQMGGDLSDIPKEFLERQGLQRDPTLDMEIATDFPQIRPPEGSALIWKLDNKDAVDCQRYVLNRGNLFVEHPFLWSPKYPRYVIYPFEYHDRVIGWIARNIDPEKNYAHLKCTNFPTDYMLNQEHAWHQPNCLVQEGTFDAVALRSLCTFGNVVSRKQVNFLNRVKLAGKRIILLPDYQKDEWVPYWQTAKEHGFSLCVPQWPNSGTGEDHIKDAGESIQRNGLIRTVEAILEGITDNYHLAKITLSARSRGN